MQQNQHTNSSEFALDKIKIKIVYFDLIYKCVPN